MATAKDDASTDIETLTKKFATDMNGECEKLRDAQLTAMKKEEEKAAKAAKGKDDKKKPEKKEPEPAVITFALDTSDATKSRTPAEQAQQVVNNKSWVCWGAHMADKARHVVMRADGKVNWAPKKALGDDFDAFKKVWGTTMKKHGLKNAKGGDGWFEGDAFHLELDESKIAKTDERVKACFEEYARLSRKEGKGTNDKFEKAYASDLKAYLAKYPSEEEPKK